MRALAILAAPVPVPNGGLVPGRRFAAELGFPALAHPPDHQEHAADLRQQCG
jgi:hypothetical protein